MGFSVLLDGNLIVYRSPTASLSDIMIAIKIKIVLIRTREFNSEVHHSLN